jgi:hypothetical protein
MKPHEISNFWGFFSGQEGIKMNLANYARSKNSQGGNIIE